MQAKFNRRCTRINTNKIYSNAGFSSEFHFLWEVFAIESSAFFGVRLRLLFLAVKRATRNSSLSRVEAWLNKRVDCPEQFGVSEGLGKIF